MKHYNFIPVIVGLLITAASCSLSIYFLCNYTVETVIFYICFYAYVVYEIKTTQIKEY